MKKLRILLLLILFFLTGGGTAYAQSVENEAPVDHPEIQEEAVEKNTEDKIESAQIRDVAILEGQDTESQEIGKEEPGIEEEEDGAEIAEEENTEAKESPEKQLLDEPKDLESEEESSTTLQKEKELISEDEEEMSLTIGEEAIPTPVGGSSGGSGSGYVAPIYGKLKYGFKIVKVSQDDQNPMKVVFRITNLKTEEEHIIVTDEEGRVNGISLAETLDAYISKVSKLSDNPTDYYKDEKKDRPDIYGRSEKETQAPELKYSVSEILGQSVQPTDIPESKTNQNDVFKGEVNDFLEEKNSDNFLHYDKFYQDDYVVFKKKHESEKINIKLTIKYGENSGSPNNGKSEDPILYENIDSEKFDLDVFIREIEDFMAAKAKVKSKEENKTFNYGKYTIEIIDTDRPKYKVEELRTDTNLNYNLKTFYLQPGDRDTSLDDNFHSPSDKKGKIFMGYNEDEITTPILSSADKNSENLQEKRDEIDKALENINKRIKELLEGQKFYEIQRDDDSSTSTGSETEYFITIKDLNSGKRTDPENLMDEFGNLISSKNMGPSPHFPGGPKGSRIDLSITDYDEDMTFENLEEAQGYMDTFNIFNYGSGNFVINPQSVYSEFMTRDNILIRVYAEKKSKLMEVNNSPIVGQTDGSKKIGSFDNAYDAYAYLEEIKNLPNEYYDLVMERYKLQREKSAFEAGYTADLSPRTREKLEKALEEYYKNKEELMYEKRRYFFEGDTWELADEEYKGPFTLLVYEKDPRLLNFRLVPFDPPELSLVSWIHTRNELKMHIEKAKLELKLEDKIEFETREELEKWFNEKGIGSLDIRLEEAKKEIRQKLFNISPKNPDKTLKVENEKFDFDTLATHESGLDKEVKKSTNTLIQDKITFDKFNIGSKYTFIGRLINKRTGEEVKTLEPIKYETGVLAKRDSGEEGIILKITFDSSKYQVGDEFVLLYDIYENGKLAGKEADINNALQTVTLIDGETPPEEPKDPPEDPKEPPEEPKDPPEDPKEPPEEPKNPPEEAEEPPVTPSEEAEEVTVVPIVEVEETPVVSPKKAGGAPQTGVESVGSYVLIAISSGLGLGYIRRKKH